MSWLAMMLRATHLFFRSSGTVRRAGRLYCIALLGICLLPWASHAQPAGGQASTRELALRVAAVLHLPGSPQDAEQALNTLYILIQGKGVVAVDVSDPAVPKFLQLFGSSQAMALSIQKQELILRLADGSSAVYSIQNPGEPLFSRSLPALTYGSSAAYSIQNPGEPLFSRSLPALTYEGWPSSLSGRMKLTAIGGTLTLAGVALGLAGASIPGGYAEGKAHRALGTVLPGCILLIAGVPMLVVGIPRLRESRATIIEASRDPNRRPAVLASLHRSLRNARTGTIISGVAFGAGALLTVLGWSVGSSYSVNTGRFITYPFFYVGIAGTVLGVLSLGPLIGFSLSYGFHNSVLSQIDPGGSSRRFLSVAPSFSRDTIGLSLSGQF